MRHCRVESQFCSPARAPCWAWRRSSSWSYTRAERGPAQYNSGMISRSGSRSTMLVAFIVVAVAVAFADSSIVVLALPELYTKFHTTIQRVSWVVTGYNAAVAVAALAMVFFVHRLRAATVLGIGLLTFTAASIACSLADTLWFLVGARCVQGVGAALLLAGSLPVL